MPIYTAEFSAIVANPLFLIPSLAMNYYLYKSSYSLFYMDRSIITNIFLKSNGKQIIAETRAGKSKVINIMDIYQQKQVDLKLDKRLEFYHGANIYCQIRGGTTILDEWLLTAIMENRCVDVRNVDFDFDITKEFTWDFRELVEIKKRKRVVHKVYKPTMKVLGKLRNAQAFEKSRDDGQVIGTPKPFKGYDMFEFLPDIHEEDREIAAA